MNQPVHSGVFFFLVMEGRNGKKSAEIPRMMEQTIFHINPPLVDI